jgi:predicted dehydrogenase
VNAQFGLRIGLVGCGYQGGNFVNAIAADKVMRVVACADPDPVAAAATAARAGNAAVHASVEDLLTGSEVDAVIVATSHDALFACSMAAIRAGKPVLVEKPIALNERDAILLQEAAAGKGVCFMSGYSFRHLAAWQKAHELLQAGVVGEIHTICGRIGIGPMSTGWRARLETGGGPMFYVGSHLIDQMLWCMADDPVEVSSHIRRRADTGADETTTFQIKFARGAIAQGMVTQTAIGGLHHALEVHGRQGRLNLNGYGFTVGLTLVSGVNPAYAQPTAIAFPQIEDLRILMHRPQLAEFSAAIRERRQPACSAADGRIALRVIDALFQSDRIGQPVRLD